MDVTIDEWLFHYLASNNEEEHLRAGDILNKIFERCDRIVLLKGSPMNEKINLLSKTNFPKQRNITKNFFRRFAYNSEKLKLIENVDELSDEITKLLPKQEKDKDKYLIQTVLATADKVIVTTDRKLKESIHEKCGIRVMLVEEFWEEIRDARE